MEQESIWSQADDTTHSRGPEQVTRPYFAHVDPCEKSSQLLRLRLSRRGEGYVDMSLYDPLGVAAFSNLDLHLRMHPLTRMSGRDGPDTGAFCWVVLCEYHARTAEWIS